PAHARDRLEVTCGRQFPTRFTPTLVGPTPLSPLSATPGTASPRPAGRPDGRDRWVSTEEGDCPRIPTHQTAVGRSVSAGPGDVPLGAQPAPRQPADHPPGDRRPPRRRPQAPTHRWTVGTGSQDLAAPVSAATCGPSLPPRLDGLARGPSGV